MKNEKNAKKLLNNKKGNIILDKLIKVSENKFCFNSRSEKKFYIENKKYLDIVNKYSYLWNFLNNYYLWRNKDREDLFFMYQYIKENSGEIDKIIKVLERIMELGFASLVFNKDFDFTNEIFTLESNIVNNTSFTYLDNLEVIPGYDLTEVKYKSNGSNFKIEFGNKDARLTRGTSYIEVNSLCFDIDKLPKNSNNQEIFNNLLSLRENNKKEFCVIRDSVYLNVELEDATDLIKKINEIIQGIDNVKTKEELKGYLATVTDSLSKMQTSINIYDKENIKKCKYVTSDVLEKEKELYKQRLSSSSIHCCW